MDSLSRSKIGNLTNIANEQLFCFVSVAVMKCFGFNFSVELSNLEKLPRNIFSRRKMRNKICCPPETWLEKNSNEAKKIR